MNYIIITTIIILIYIIFYLILKLRYYRNEYHHVLTTGLNMKIFIIDNDMDSEWEKFIERIGK